MACGRDPLAQVQLLFLQFSPRCLRFSGQFTEPEKPLLGHRITDIVSSPITGRPSPKNGIRSRAQAIGWAQRTEKSTESEMQMIDYPKSMIKKQRKNLNRCVDRVAR